MSDYSFDRLIDEFNESQRGEAFIDNALIEKEKEFLEEGQQEAIQEFKKAYENLELAKRETELANQKLELEKKEVELDHLETEHETRIGLVHKLLIVTIIWMALMLITVICTGLRYVVLSDTVIVTLITTTTTEVLGFMYIVLKYMFHINQNKDA